MSSSKQNRSQDDFDEMSWHDNHVHALRIEESEHGTGRLILDLDYILEWLPAAMGRCRFKVAPATLTFIGVSGLKIELDWAAVSAGITPFSISAIGEQTLTIPMHGAGVST